MKETITHTPTPTHTQTHTVISFQESQMSNPHSFSSGSRILKEAAWRSIFDRFCCLSILKGFLHLKEQKKEKIKSHQPRVALTLQSSVCLDYLPLLPDCRCMLLCSCSEKEAHTSTHSMKTLCAGASTPCRSVLWCVQAGRWKNVEAAEAPTLQKVQVNNASWRD